MAGRGYCIFDSTVGRCGIAWGGSGILGVQFPEAREIETRRRMLRQYPDARDLASPHCCAGNPAISPMWCSI
jgi:methylated-DNA-[protein]-cysteine S-methyltransferase